MYLPTSQLWAKNQQNKLFFQAWSKMLRSFTINPEKQHFFYNFKYVLLQKSFFWNSLKKKISYIHAPSHFFNNG